MIYQIDFYKILDEDFHLPKLKPKKIARSARRYSSGDGKRSFDAF